MTGTGVSWNTPANAINGNQTNGSYISFGGTDSVRMLRCHALPAALFTDVHDQADVSKFTITWDHIAARGAGASYTPTYALRLMQDTAVKSSSGQQSGSTSWNNKSYTWTYPQGQTYITGAQLKSGNFGAGFEPDVGATKFGTIQIRNVKMVVCYRNPDLPPTTLDVPLLFCEA